MRTIPSPSTILFTNNGNVSMPMMRAIADDAMQAVSRIILLLMIGSTPLATETGGVCSASGVNSNY